MKDSADLPGPQRGTGNERRATSNEYELRICYDWRIAPLKETLKKAEGERRQHPTHTRAAVLVTASPDHHIPDGGIAAATAAASNKIPAAITAFQWRLIVM